MCGLSMIDGKDMTVVNERGDGSRTYVIRTRYAPHQRYRLTNNLLGNRCTWIGANSGRQRDGKESPRRKYLIAAFVLVALFYCFSLTLPPMARLPSPRILAALVIIFSVFVINSLWPLLSEAYSTMAFTPNLKTDVKSLTFTYKSVHDHPIKVDIYPPTLGSGHRTIPKVPAVLYFHGGGLAVGDRASWFPSWLQSTRSLES